MAAKLETVSTAPNMDDRRLAPRVDLEGRYSLMVDCRDGSEPVECAILDFSVTGVRIVVPEGVTLPDDVQVVIGEISHNARVVWRRDGIAGVDLVDEHYSIY
ncbi:MAG: PilZ domain-containing protein [Alphaproteobacteria bacterium]|nr:PilZ domain-containing protein [Alphaproteobacteria bacterium]